MEPVLLSPIINLKKNDNYCNNNNNENSSENENENEEYENQKQNNNNNNKLNENENENANTIKNTNDKEKENLNDFIYESPKNLNINLYNNSGFNTRADTVGNNLYSYSNNTVPMITTNSFGKTTTKGKFNLTNMQTQYSKNQLSQCLSSNSNSSKYPIPTFISVSSLQGHNSIKYSIPKETRFSNSYRIATCQSIYNLTDYNKPKGITIPHSSRKNNFNKEDLTPSSQDYVMTSLFEENLKAKKGISIKNKFSFPVNLYKKFL